MLEKFATLLGMLPPDAVPALGRLLSALLSGNSEKAAREARVTAETIAAKEAIRGPYRLRKK